MLLCASIEVWGGIFLIIHKCHTRARYPTLSANSALKSASWCFCFVCGHFPLECSTFFQLNVGVDPLNWHVFEVVTAITEISVFKWVYFNVMSTHPYLNNADIFKFALNPASVSSQITHIQSAFCMFVKPSVHI